MGRILIVDDDSEIAESLAAVLREEGFEATDVRNAGAMMRQLHAGGVDAVVLDVMMPYCDGFELLQHMRGQELFSNVPIVVMSASARWKEAQERARQLGAKAYLTKPFHPDHLIRVLKAALG